MASDLFLCLYGCSYCQALPLLFPLQRETALTQFSSMTVERKAERCFTAPCFHPGVCVCVAFTLFCLPVNQSSVGSLTHTHINPKDSGYPRFWSPSKRLLGAELSKQMWAWPRRTPLALWCALKEHMSADSDCRPIHRGPVWECTGWQIKETFPSVWNGSQTSPSQNALKPHPELNKEKEHAQAIFHPKIKWVKNKTLYLK